MISRSKQMHDIKELLHSSPYPQGEVQNAPKRTEIGLTVPYIFVCTLFRCFLMDATSITYWIYWMRSR